MQFYLAELEPGVDKLQIRRLVHRQRKDLPDKFNDIQVDSGLALLVWVWSLLSKRQALEASQIDFLVELLGSELEMVGRTIAEKLEARSPEVPVHLLVITDGTFVGLTGWNHFLDLRSGDKASGLSQAPIENISYNLTALYALHLRRVLLDRQSNKVDSHAAECSESSNSLLAKS